LVVCILYTMAEAGKEKAVAKALKLLTPFLTKKLPPYVCHELYARDMLTWHEKDAIGELDRIFNSELVEIAEG